MAGNRSGRLVAGAGVGIWAAMALAVVTAAPAAYGWGSGHLTQADMVMSVLPKEILDYFPKDLQQKIRREYVEYPDAYQNITEKSVGKDAMDFLAKPPKGTGWDGRTTRCCASCCSAGRFARTIPRTRPSGPAASSTPPATTTATCR